MTRRKLDPRDRTALLKRFYGSTDDATLAKALGISQADLRLGAEAWGLSKDKATFKGRPMPRWRSIDVARLEQLYPYNDNLTIARQLGRSVKSVVSKAHQLGLRKDPVRLRDMGRENVALRRDRYSPPLAAGAT